MTRWKMVPVKLTPEMRSYLREWLGHSEAAVAAMWHQLLAAAPDWEPSDEDVERAWVAFSFPPTGKKLDRSVESMRAALKAAIGGHDEH